MQLKHPNLQNGVIKRIIKKNIRNEIEETGSGNRVVDQNVDYSAIYPSII